MLAAEPHSKTSTGGEAADVGEVGNEVRKRSPWPDRRIQTISDVGLLVAAEITSR